MSDYISKSALKEELRKGQETIKDRLDEITTSSIYETIEVVIKEIDRQPTISETEIIRKAFERVSERLEEQEDHYQEMNNIFGMAAIEEAKIIVKEECGISE